MLDDVTTRDIFEPIWIKAIKKKFGIDNNEFNVSLILKKEVKWNTLQKICCRFYLQ